MSAIIHGWRVYTFRRCSSHSTLALAGSYGMHVHDRESPRAACEGSSGAMWMTPEAKRLPSGTKHEDTCPNFECTCGFYGHRLYEQVDKGINKQLVVAIAHVTALGKTILHTDGFRTARYHIDFFVTPRTPESIVWVPKSLEPGSDPAMTSWGPYWVGEGESIKMGPLLTEIADELKVPILDKDSFNACPDCLVANKWATEEQVAVEKIKARQLQWDRGK